VAYLLMTHADLVRHQHVLVYNDNSSFVQAFNNAKAGKTSRSTRLTSLIHTLTILQAKLDCELHMHHQRGDTPRGMRADMLSRGKVNAYIAASPQSSQPTPISTDIIPHSPRDVIIF
jgi:hypothetical protein